jgi:transcriptional regulator with GAF, ATPase, and Fis domain
MGAEAKDLFGSRRLKEVRDQEVVQASLYEEIGRLTMELDWVIKLQASAEEKRRWIDPGHPESKHPPPMRAAHNSTDLVWASPAASEAIKTVKSVSGTDATVLVTGETGTGKEAIARLIHALSARKNKALVKLDCTTIPANLAESELFGHEKGAFTGALSRKLGRFDLADGGTIFLDEIGELPLEVQAKLLRVLQEGKFERVGGTSTLAADVPA